MEKMEKDVKIQPEVIITTNVKTEKIRKVKEQQPPKAWKPACKELTYASALREVLVQQKKQKQQNDKKHRSNKVIKQ